MIQIFFKIAFRTLFKQRIFTLINLVSLAAGISVFVFLLMYIQHELSYDKFHQNSEDIYRVVYEYNKDGLGEESATSPFPMSPLLAQRYSDYVVHSTRIFNYQINRHLVAFGKRQFNESDFFFVDSGFFDVFTLKFLQGEPDNLEKNPYTIAISQSAAEKYFGKQNPMEKTLSYQGGIEYLVVGVFEDFPLESHFRPQFLAPLASTRMQNTKSWVWNACWTYVKLKPGVAANELESMFPEIVNNHFFDSEKEYVSLRLQPLEAIHLHSGLDYEIERNNNIMNIYLLLAIAISVVVISFINFLNMTTAASVRRAKEIGIKKVHGVHKYQLVIQFLLEALLLSFIATLLALLIVEMGLPFFNNLVNKSLSFSYVFRFSILIYLIITILLGGIFAGLYPAFVMSRQNPALIVKGIPRSDKSNIRITKSLVVLQYAISIAIIIVAFFNLKQLEFLRSADLGFSRNNVLILPIYNTPIVDNYTGFYNYLTKSEAISSVTATREMLGVSHNTSKFIPQGFAEEKAQFYSDMVVWFNFIETFEIKLLAGRAFNEDENKDLSQAVIVNEEMVKHLGFKDNKDIIGKSFHSFYGQERIIGVINNINVSSLHSGVKPFVLHLGNGRFSWYIKYLAIKMEPDKQAEAIEHVKKAWHIFAPERPIEYSFLDEELRQLYLSETFLSRLSIIFTVIALIIASIGILGLTAFLTIQRTREIGIRKVLGSSVMDIIRLLSKEFVFLVIISNLLAWPLAYYAISKWLQVFAYHTQVDVLLFITAAILALLFALIVVVIQAYKAHNKNTLNAIKYE